MYKQLFFLCFIGLAACHNLNTSSRFQEIDLTSVDLLSDVDNSQGINILLDKAVKQVNTSDLIKDVVYIPLETTDSSLISHISMTEIYKDRIYILDNIMQQKVYIFDIDGNFIKTIGQKGGGPGEYSLLAGMAIDRVHEWLIIYDNLKRKFMYYTLNGDFIRSVETKFSFSGEMMAALDGSLMSVTYKYDRNTHLKELNDYRIVYTDSLGNVVRGSFKYDDNENLATAWSQLYRVEDELVFYPQYMNSLYTINDSTITLRYQIDLSNYSPYKLSDIIKAESRDERREIRKSSTYLEPNMIENMDYLYFAVVDKDLYIHTFYHKESGKMISFNDVICDGDCIFNPMISRMSSFEDYFVSTIPVDILKAIKTEREKTYNNLSEEISSMVDNLKEDDNNVLVLFKINEL